MHARIHDDQAAQDIRNMGGLRKWLPLTHGTFAAATAAIIGLPLTSGFFSKDEILYRAFVDHTVNPMGQSRLLHGRVFEPPTWIGPALWAVSLIAALLTAFYMCRLYFLTFWGDFRGWKVGRPSLLARHEAAPAAAASSGHHLGAQDLAQPGYAPHESPWEMTVPLIALAAFSLFPGLLNPGFGIRFQPMEHWLEPVFKSATEGAVFIGVGHDKAWAERMIGPLGLCGVGAFAIGSFAAWWVYVARAGEPARRLSAAAPRLYRLVLDKWRIDELYDVTVIGLVDAVADTAAEFDRTVVDGVLARLTSLVVAASGTVLRSFQTGVVHVYAATMVVGLAGFVWFFVTPHPEATVVDAGNDDYTLSAAPDYKEPTSMEDTTSFFDQDAF